MRLELISVDDLLRLQADLRDKGLAEATLAVVLSVLDRVFKFAAGRMGWAGQNRIALLERADRPKTSQARRKRIFTAEELRLTLSASRAPYRTIFALLADTGARISEVLGLTWENVWLDADDPRVAFRGQLDDEGNFVPTKTQASTGTVPISQVMGALLREHAASSHAGAVFLFETVTARPYDRHNIGRELRQTIDRARTEDGQVVFVPSAGYTLEGKPIYRRGDRPSLHSFRHTTATTLLYGGASVEAVSRRLRHKDSTVTRAVYLHEIEDAERRAIERGLIEQPMGDALG